MTAPRDRWRASVGRAASTGRAWLRTKVEQSDTAQAVRRLIAGQVLVPTTALARAVGRIEGVTQSTLLVTEGAFAVDLEVGPRVTRARLEAPSLAFAPRGAKELSFRISPDHASSAPDVGRVVAAIGEAVLASMLSIPTDAWRTAGETPTTRTDATVTVDLRDALAIPSHRHARSRIAALDVLAPRGARVVADGLVLELGLPAFGA